MALPVAFLLGLLVVLVHRELLPPLPGEAMAEPVLMASLLLLCPALLAMWAQAQARRGLLSGHQQVLPARSLLWLSAAATPMVVHMLFAWGSYGDCIDRLAPDSHLLRVLLALAPLYLAELPRFVAATMAEALLEVDVATRGRLPVAAALLPRMRDVWPFIRLRLGWPLLALLPASLLGACLDLLQLHRESYVFVLATSFGTALAAIAFFLLAAATLPFWFRVAFGTTGALPEPLGATLRSVARALDFPPHRVLMLPTGGRAMNAMMVGPLPIGRHLCMTDGLLATLDSRSLSGVLAHEIGHARMGHPGILMMLAAMLPLLLFLPLRLLDTEQVDVTLQSVGLVVVTLSVWWSVRALARRFEHEADVASVRALGAEPCSRALQQVSRWATPVVHRLSGRLLSLHPDERERLLVMRRYEQEPRFRELFDRRSRQIRLGVVGLVALAIGMAAWAWRSDWQYERVFVEFYTGDFVSARASLPASEDTPAAWRDAFDEIGDELAAALELAPGSRDWTTARQRLDPAAWQRGEQVLLAKGPAAARPWFALAVAVMASPSTTELAIHDYCSAAAAGEPQRVERLGRIIRRRGAPEALEPVFAGYR